MADERAGTKLDHEHLDVAVRAWAVRASQVVDDSEPGGAKRTAHRRVADHFLVFDTETTIDPSQRLLFGCWRYLRATHDDGLRLHTLEEGLFYPDDLEDWNPEGYLVLKDFERRRAPAAVDRRHLDASPALQVIPLSDFLERKVWRAAYELRAGLVCFNFPFDVSRLAWRAGATRNRRAGRRADAFEGGFSLALWSYERDGTRRDSRHRPRVAIKSIDSKRALKEFRSPREVDEEDLITDRADPSPAETARVFRGDFLDLRTLVFALTDRGHSLESACNAFGVPYKKRDVELGAISPEAVEYCREDVEATGRLCEASTREFLKHPIDLRAASAFSPATIGKSYLKAMGVRPVLRRQRFDPRVLGWSMAAYYGGRAECRIRRTPVPVAYCDFLSMYPTVCSLMKLWELLTAEHIDVDESAGPQVQALLDRVDADECFRRQLWPELVGIAEIVPDGDVVPTRARYGSSLSWQIGLNPLTSTETMWFTIADLVAAKILTGKAPKVLRAIRFQASGGRAAGLRPVDLLGVTRVDPVSQDFFRAVVEERRRTEARSDLPPEERKWRSDGLKVLANATSYGIYAQMTRHDLAAGRRESVTVHGRGEEPHTARVAGPEDPGVYTFPPVAAAITGGARLLLAMLERQVTQAGGTYAYCDTDSMAIVANEHGGSVACRGGTEATPNGAQAVRALSWADVDAIRARFEVLKPYNPTVVTADLLELEDENFAQSNSGRERQELWCYAISAKRYALYTHKVDGNPVLRSWSDVDGGIDTGGSDEPGDEALVKPSQHGLGHLLNPLDPESDSRDWITEAWQLLLRANPDLPDDGPEWLAHPAVSRTSVSSPYLLRLFGELNDDNPYREQIKPFNFMATCFILRPERPADDQRMVLVAPYEKDPSKWLAAPWWNRYSGRQYQLSPDRFEGYVRPGIVRPRTYRDILTAYLTNEEAKSLAPDGQACQPDTQGLLRRRPVRIQTITHIGKESNRLEDRQSGLLDGVDEFLNHYDDFYTSVFAPVVVPVLRDLGVRETARRTGHSVGAVSAALSGHSRPRAAQLKRYIDAAEAHARTELARTGQDVPEGGPIAVMRAYLEMLSDG